MCPCLMSGHYAVQGFVVLPLFLDVHKLGVKLRMNVVAATCFAELRASNRLFMLTNTDITVLYSISLFLVSSNKSVTFIPI
jgi:hypothetical protein